MGTAGWRGDGRAAAMARRTVEALDETRLHWVVDPDGRQLLA